MTVEASLTRELDIRFIDARVLATEAKLNLGLTCYPGKAQERLITREAIRIFREERPEQFKTILRQQKADLESAKALFDDSDRTVSTSTELSVDKSTSSGGGFWRNASVKMNLMTMSHV